MSLLSELWARRQRRPTLVVTAALVGGSLLAYPLVDLWLRMTFEFTQNFEFGDFGAYIRAVNSWEAGEDLYRRREDGSFWGTFLYPPVVVLLFAVVIDAAYLGFDPAMTAAELFVTPTIDLLGIPYLGSIQVGKFRWAAMVWIGTTWLLLWVSLQALIAALGYELRWYERGVLAWLLAGFQPVILTAKLGQTALFLAALLSFAAAAMIRGADDAGDGEGAADGAGSADTRWALVSGACTALVGIVKFAYAPIGAHLLHDRRRMLGAFLVVPPLAWLSIRFFGIDAHRTYIEVLQWGVGKGSDSPRAPTLWLAPYFKPLGWTGFAQAIRLLASLGVVVLAVLAPPRARTTVFALGVATFPLFTPQTYVYYFVALLPVAVILLAGELRRDGYPEVVLVGVLLVHLHSYGLKFLVETMPEWLPIWGELLEPHYLLLQPGLWGNALLFGLAAVRVGQTVEWPALRDVEAADPGES